MNRPPLTTASPVTAPPKPNSAPFIRKSFPDLATLKARANAPQNKPGESWPTLILNAQTQETHRPDIRGPFSLFMNRQGQSHCTIEGYEILVPEDTFLISNAGQYYSLEIESKTPVETFNVHLGNALLEQIQASLSLKPETLLLDPLAPVTQPFVFPNRLNRKDAFVCQWLEKARLHEDPASLEANLQDLIVYLLLGQKQIQAEIKRLPALKQGTKQELHLRLNRARDCLYAQPLYAFSLEELAQIACLSKYHFLRMFRAAYGCTPHQFQLQLRVEKARVLLAQTQLSVQAIANLLCFDEPASFSRLFRKKVGVYPSQYRNLL